MAEASSFDVAVVGASVAGCAAATLLAREGLRVALLEKNRGMDAYKKVCTHYLQPGATPVLKRLGVDGAIEAAGGVRNAIDLWTPAGWLLRADHLPHGYNIRREKLDPILRRQAAATPGVTLLSGHMVQGVLTEGGQVRGLVAREAETGQTRELRARLVVGADGRGSPVARLGGRGGGGGGGGLAGGAAGGGGRVRVAQRAFHLLRAVQAPAAELGPPLAALVPGAGGGLRLHQR